MKYILMSLCVVGLVACDKTGPLDAKDPKAIYLAGNLPQVKVIRDQLAFEYVACKHNIERLQAITATFDHEESKRRLRVKVESMKLLKEQIKHHLDKIDEQAEHGIALRVINQVDGGGLRLPDIQNILFQSNICLKTAKQANLSAVSLYDTSNEVSPPKVIAVKRN